MAKVRIVQDCAAISATAEFLYRLHVNKTRFATVQVSKPCIGRTNENNTATRIAIQHSGATQVALIGWIRQQYYLLKLVPVTPSFVDPQRAQRTFNPILPHAKRSVVSVAVSMYVCMYVHSEP